MITFKELKELPGVLAVFGKALPDETPLSFGADTRSLPAGSSFVALDGERFRPLKFLDQLGAAPVVVYAKNEANDALTAPFVEKNCFVAVDDCVVFLQKIAQAIAARFVASGGKLIAISGSNGKTTTKEMLYRLLLAVEPNTTCTQKNNNNHIGVPLTLLQIQRATKFCALELGSNHPGEIKILCDIANPNVGVTTNIGDTHLEFFGNQERVFAEEGYLYSAIEMSKSGDKLFFQNKDDAWLRTLPEKPFVRTYGSGADNDLVIRADFDRVSIVKPGSGSVEIENPLLTGKHNFLNLGVAFSMARELLPNHEEALAQAAANFAPTANRSQWLSLGNAQVFLDAYNANPSSMRAAIMGFRERCRAEGLSLQDTALLLGDMNELGPEAEKFHFELGQFCAENGFERLYFVGRFAGNYRDGAGGIGEVYPGAAEFIEAGREEFLSFKRCFIKGSRSLQLESIADIN